jgi:hypothetical protein
MSSHVCHVVITDCKKSKHEVVVASNDIMFISSFEKVDQLVERENIHTHTHTHSMVTS